MKAMPERTRVSGRIWSIVLGGGDAGRMTDFIQRWPGYPRPKQYCTFVGDRSLFQHTRRPYGPMSAVRANMSAVAGF